MRSIKISSEESMTLNFPNEKQSRKLFCWKWEGDGGSLHKVNGVSSTAMAVQYYDSPPYFDDFSRLIRFFLLTADLINVNAKIIQLR